MYLFFNELSQIMTTGTSISLSIHSQNGKLTVSVFPKQNGLKDEAQKHLQPIVLTGTAEELDAGFLDAINKPVQKATGLLADMKVFEESLARVEAEKKEALEKKRNAEKKADEQNKTLSKQAKARREKYENFIAKADAQEKDENYANAIVYLREAQKIAEGDEIDEIDDRIEELKEKSLQNSLFSNG